MGDNHSDIGISQGAGISPFSRTTAERRANHNATERVRRELLNEKFQELAESLPNIPESRKPSKAVIIQKSLDYVRTSQKRIHQLIQLVNNLAKENSTLKQDLNAIRRESGLPELEATDTAKLLAITKEIEVGFRLNQVSSSFQLPTPAMSPNASIMMGMNMSQQDMKHPSPSHPHLDMATLNFTSMISGGLQSAPPDLAPTLFTPDSFDHIIDGSNTDPLISPAMPSPGFLAPPEMRFSLEGRRARTLSNLSSYSGMTDLDDDTLSFISEVHSPRPQSPFIDHGLPTAELDNDLMENFSSFH